MAKEMEKERESGEKFSRRKEGSDKVQRRSILILLLVTTLVSLALYLKQHFDQGLKLNLDFNVDFDFGGQKTLIFEK